MTRDAVATMLEARSVAVVGASPREGSFGEMMMLELTRAGFDGDIYPVNPKYEEILGHRAYPSVSEVPVSVDIAILGVSNSRIEGALTEAADSGARSAAIFASCYEDPKDGVPPLTERLAKIARDAGMAVCGGNCMGFLNMENGLRVCGYVEPERPAGSVAFISHSGSAFSAMAYNNRDLEFNLLVSAGQELVTTAADYMTYALERESTKAVGLFIETVRDPDKFHLALERAAERDIPVVALKVGREEGAREMVQAHSGALAGEDGAYEALFDAYGVQRVNSLHEMCDTLELFTRNGRRAGPGAFASIHDSGGERALMIDSAAEVGVPFAQISDETKKRLEESLEEGLPAVNPLDAWGTVEEAPRVFTECIEALLDDPDTAALAFAVDMTSEDDEEFSNAAFAERTLVDRDKPVAVLSNLSSAIHAPDAKKLREIGIPVLEDTLTGLAAFKHLFDYRDFHARPPAGKAALPGDDTRSRWRERLSTGEPLAEVEGLSLLSDYGVPVVGAEPAASAEEARAAAEKVGYPVAVKTAEPGVLHKSDAGGVKLGLETDEDVSAGYEELAASLGPRVVVAPMVSPGVEFALGVVRDPQFGPLVLVAAGGIFVELLKDRRLALPPVDEAGARRLLDGLKTRPLLDGVRGAPSADIDSIARAIVAVSSLASDLGEHLEALDANPLIAGPDGCVVVDALVIPRRV
ncbi:MAG: acetate--CoA ligase family protein [Actinomycetota bacterium]